MCYPTHSPNIPVPFTTIFFQPSHSHTWKNVDPNVTNASHDVGLFKHSQELTRGYLSNCSPSSSHSTVFGRFNAASSVGFIVGPIVGGHVAATAGGFSLVAYCSAATFCLMLGGSVVTKIRIRITLNWLLSI